MFGDKLKGELNSAKSLSLHLNHLPSVARGVDMNEDKKVKVVK